MLLSGNTMNAVAAEFWQTDEESGLGQNWVFLPKHSIVVFERL